MLAGVDLAREEFNNYTLTLPAGVALDKNDAAHDDRHAERRHRSVDESLRIRTPEPQLRRQGARRLRAGPGEVAPAWKVLAGLRWDRFEGDYRQPGDGATVPGRPSRSDSLWSQRFGVLFQPTDTMIVLRVVRHLVQHLGRALQLRRCRAANAPPGEEPQHRGRRQARPVRRPPVDAASPLFQSTKYNERNRDSPDGQPIVDYLLSGKRHAAGLELDLAGRITPAWEVYGSYAWIPSAKIDEAAFGVDAERRAASATGRR